LDQLDLALGGANHLLEHRGELLARAAPRRPEIDQHRLAPRLLDHVLHEGLGGRLLDEPIRGRCGGGPAVLQHAVDPSTPQGRPNLVSEPRVTQLNGGYGGRMQSPPGRPGRWLTPDRRAPQPARSARCARWRRGTAPGRRGRSRSSWY